MTILFATDQKMVAIAKDAKTTQSIFSSLCATLENLVSDWSLR